MSIGENLKKYRNEKKVSQRKLAQTAGVSFAYIQQLEKNEKQNPSIEIITKLSNALEINVNDLIGPIFNSKTFINEKNEKTIVAAKNNGEISESDAIEGLAKYINFIANSENYVMASEYTELIRSADELLRGKILILKRNRGNEIKL